MLKNWRSDLNFGGKFKFSSFYFVRSDLNWSKTNEFFSPKFVFSNFPQCLGFSAKNVSVVLLRVPAWWRHCREPLNGLPGSQLGSFFGQSTQGRLEPGLPDRDSQMVDGTADLGHVARVLHIGPEKLVWKIHSWLQIKCTSMLIYHHILENMMLKIDFQKKRMINLSWFRWTLFVL